jgi:hypothetical protein
MGALLLVGTLLAPAGSALALAAPTLTGTASGPVALGGTISDTAHLSGGSGPLTGTISYQVFAPADTTCLTPLTPPVTGSTVSGGTVYAQDGFFNRTVTAGWGSAVVGGAWTVSGAEAPGAFAVDPTNYGTQTTTASGDTAVAGLSGTYLNLDTSVRVKFDKTSVAGGENRARILVRTDAPADTRAYDYEFALSAPDGGGPLEAYIAKREGRGNDTQLAGGSTGLAQDTGSYFWIRGQVSGTTAVTLNLKVWQDGTSEPATWTATYTDTSPAAQLQGAGYVDLSSYGNSNLPLTVHFADFQAVSLGTGDYTSGAFTPIAAGTYHWIATYSGDTNNGPVSTTCGDPAQDSVVAPPAAPTVTGVNPSSGSTAGGTSVTISGTNLASATAVTFGTSAATITSDTATQIVATSPPGSAGTVHITVTTAGGTSTTSAADQFTYVAPPAAPTVTGVNPSSGSTAGGTSVTISGTNLASATAVTFGTSAATITSDTATQIVATSPPGSAGTVHITVTTAGGTSTTSAADQFTYVAPPAPVGGGGGVAPAAPRIALAVSASPTSLTGSGSVTYTYTVTNPGSVALSGVSVSDTTCSPATYVSGDTNKDGVLEPGETWTYTCSTALAVTSTDAAKATATGNDTSVSATAATTVTVTAPPALTPVTLTDGIAAGVDRGTSGFGTRSVVVARNGYITLFVQTNPNLAGSLVQIWVESKTSGWHPLTLRMVATDGTVHYFARVNGWTAYWVKFAGDTTHTPAVSHGRIATNPA